MESRQNNDTNADFESLGGALSDAYLAIENNDRAELAGALVRVAEAAEQLAEVLGAPRGSDR